MDLEYVSIAVMILVVIGLEITIAVLPEPEVCANCDPKRIEYWASCSSTENIYTKADCELRQMILDTNKSEG